jgi:uncharacterized protein (TIGR03118 family)
MDASLKNPWGVAFSQSSPFWVADNRTGVATLYNGTGAKVALTVTIPPGGGAGTPTGQVFNGTAGFNGDTFIFDTQDGTIAGWRGNLGTTAETLFTSADGAAYTGLAIASISSNGYLYAADIHNNHIDVVPASGAPPLTGTFTDTTLPAGLSAFNIQLIGTMLYVTYAKPNAAGNNGVPGAGSGVVDVYNLNGDFQKRLATGGSLNAPWGITQAPLGFGSIGGDFLIGNFGDGVINVYDSSGTFIGTLASLMSGSPLVNSGLWALTFGNGGNGGSPNSLYLTAGLNGQAGGLLARIDAVPEPGTFALLAVGSGVVWWRCRKR